MTALLVIVILVVLIVVHELGHFFAAKILGVKVEEFGVGYPPRAFLLGKIGDTQYTLNWIPFGGFVRLFGEEGEGAVGAGAFSKASRSRQAIILIAGVFMNMLLGWLLFASALHMGIPRPVQAPGAGVQLFISEVVAGSPADAGRLRAGDVVLSVVDANGNEPESLSPKAIAEYMNDHGGKRVALVYERNGTSSITNVTPANGVIPSAPERAGLGVGLVLVSSAPLSWGASFVGAFTEMQDAFTRVALNVLSMIKHSFMGSLNLNGVIGPVGLVSVVGAAAQTGFAQVLALAAFISVNLAVINLIPIPALDGGRLAILGVESVLRREAPKLAIHLLNMVGIIAIVLLMVVVTYHDIARLVT